MLRMFTSTKNLSNNLLLILTDMDRFKIFIDSANWDCSTNLIICSRLYQYFIENGHAVVQEPKESDYIIVNSCGVTDGSKDRTLHIVQKYIHLKKDKSSIILFGCLMDINRQTANDFDVIPIGFHDSQRLDTIFFLEKKFDEIRPYSDDELKKKLTRKAPSTQKKQTKESIKNRLIDMHPFILSFPVIFLSEQARKNYQRMISHYANNIYVEISKGCTGNCNFCLIKKAKGTVHSRDIQDILEDIQKVYTPSKELCLVADDCGCYGVDTRSNIIQLLDVIHETFPDLRLKINYIDPSYFLKYSKEFLRIFQTMTITTTMIPLQSGSQKVLKNMNREYDVNNVLEVIKKIRKISPWTIIYTHFIVGHPGETWNEYRKSLGAARFFDLAMPFKYSNNKGTVSARMSDQVSRPVSFFRYLLFLFYMNVLVFLRISDTLKIKNNL
jgi:tRNA A37 methylthiotransferase MiaB